MCTWVSYVVPVGMTYYGAGGEMRAVTMCQEHGMEVATAGHLCPIGKIEEATAAAIAEITAAKNTS